VLANYVIASMLVPVGRRTRLFRYCWPALLTASRTTT